MALNSPTELQQAAARVSILHKPCDLCRMRMLIQRAPCKNLVDLRQKMMFDSAKKSPFDGLATVCLRVDGHAVGTMRQLSRL